MSKKQKITLISVFAVIVVVVAVVGLILNDRETQTGKKEFQIEIVSERDGVNEVKSYESDAEYLGTFLRTMEGCTWNEAELGSYITGFNGMMEDVDNQYWWCLTVNDADNLVGVDELPLQDGNKYTFTLTQGW